MIAKFRFFFVSDWISSGFRTGVRLVTDVQSGRVYCERILKLSMVRDESYDAEVD